MGVILDTWRRQRRDRPAATRFAMTAVGSMSAAAALAAMGAGLLALLVGGLGLVPLSFAAALCLLPARFWPDGGDDGGGFGHRDDDDRGGPWPSAAPDGGIDWDRFERELWEYVDERERIAV
jgi:hypothetical protein